MARVCGRSLAGIVRSRIPPVAWMSVSFECWVLSGTSLCIGLITSPEESDRDDVSECDRKSSIKRRAWPTRGCWAMKKKMRDLIPSVPLVVLLSFILMVTQCRAVKPCLNPLKTKRRLLYLKTQFVPHSKHFSSQL